MNIKHFSEQEQTEFKVKHELAESKSWAVMDGSFIYEFYDTEEEARIGLKQANMQEAVLQAFDIWVDEQAENYGVDTDEIKSIIK